MRKSIKEGQTPHSNLRERQHLREKLPGTQQQQFVAERCGVPARTDLDASEDEDSLDSEETGEGPPKQNLPALGFPVMSPRYGFDQNPFGDAIICGGGLSREDLFQELTQEGRPVLFQFKKGQEQVMMEKLLESEKTLQGELHEAKEHSIQRSRIVRCLEVRLGNRELLSNERSHIGKELEVFARIFKAEELLILRKHEEAMVVMDVVIDLMEDILTNSETE